MILRILTLPPATRSCIVVGAVRVRHSYFSTTAILTAPDPRLKELGNVIQNDFASLREQYDAPKHPIILAHGLLGFDEMHLMGPSLPGLKYWRGIREALSKAGVEVITATVPPSGCIERRAEHLARVIEEKAGGKSVNIIA
jgi:triacylglycerol lipase